MRYSDLLRLHECMVAAVTVMPASPHTAQAITHISRLFPKKQLIGSNTHQCAANRARDLMRYFEVRLYWMEIVSLLPSFCLTQAALTVPEIAQMWLAHPVYACMHICVLSLTQSIPPQVRPAPQRPSAVLIGLINVLFILPSLPSVPATTLASVLLECAASMLFTTNQPTLTHPTLLGSCLVNIGCILSDPRMHQYVTQRHAVIGVVAQNLERINSITSSCRTT